MLLGRATPLAVAFALLVTGCVEVTVLVEMGDGGPVTSSTCIPSPANRCDDCNPCRVHALCTPCDSAGAPPGGLPGDPCTPPDEIPPLCDGRDGCVFVDRSTPSGVVADCFPVAGGEVTGVCVAGVCVAPNGG